MTDWKELEDVDRPCSDENGWCGWCGLCSEHWEYLNERDSWQEDD